MPPTETVLRSTGASPSLPTSHELDFSRRRWLIAMAVGGPVVETVILWLTGLGSASGIAAQVTAPAPFGVFHDLRWLLVFHRSWLGFALEAVAFVAFRTLLATPIFPAAWPPGLPGPPWPVV